MTLPFMTRDGGYGRLATAAIYKAHEDTEGCDMCGARDVPLLFVDCSESEYSAVALCRACINKAFDSEPTS